MSTNMNNVVMNTKGAYPFTLYRTLEFAFKHLYKTALTIESPVIEMPEATLIYSESYNGVSKNRTIKETVLEIYHVENSTYILNCLQISVKFLIDIANGPMLFRNLIEIIHNAAKHSLEDPLLGVCHDLIWLEVDTRKTKTCKDFSPFKIKLLYFPVANGTYHTKNFMIDAQVSNIKSSWLKVYRDEFAKLDVNKFILGCE